jgi:hypothetical protein
MFEPKPARDDSHDPPKQPWSLSDADREFLRVNRIDPEDGKETTVSNSRQVSSEEDSA